MIAPELLLSKGMVPWPAPVPVPGTSNTLKLPCLIEQEAVIHAVSVDVISRDRPRGVVAFREGALACPCARARNIERAEGALVRPHEAVKHTVCVDVDSFDLSVRSEAYAECAVAAARLCLRPGHRTS